MGLSNFQINGTDFDGIYVKRDIFSKGGLWSWGLNSSGQLGDNTTVDKSSPVQIVSKGLNWKQVSSGESCAAAIKSDGTLWMWGDNTYGQLGDNSRTSRSSPVQTVSAGTNWKQVSCGSRHTSAIKTDGTLWLWGYNSHGQLGDNTNGNWGTTNSKSSPVQTVSGGSNWKQVSCSPSSSHTAAIKTDGTLWAWGYNYSGQVGDNTSGADGGLSFYILNSKSSPVQTVAGGTNWNTVQCGGYHTSAIKTDGTLWLWGSNDNGQLGDNTMVSKSSPVQTVSGGSNWKKITGGFANVGAIKSDGTLWMWGYNNYGQLGDNTVTQRSSPVQTISGGTNWKSVNMSGSSSGYTAAIKTDGTLWLWGRSGLGQLGNSSTTDRSSPVQTTAGGTNWIDVDCGGSSTNAIRDNYT